MNNQSTLSKVCSKGSLGCRVFSICDVCNLWCEPFFFQGSALSLVKLGLQTADSPCWAHSSPQAPQIVSTNVVNKIEMTVIKYHLSADFQALWGSASGERGPPVFCVFTFVSSVVCSVSCHNYLVDIRISFVINSPAWMSQTSVSHSIHRLYDWTMRNKILQWWHLCGFGE